MCLGQACCPWEGQFGQKLVPTRQVEPVSNGKPTTAKYTSVVACTNGSRMNVRTPVKRGDSSELAGK